MAETNPKAVTLVGALPCGGRRVKIDKAALACTTEAELRQQIADVGVEDRQLIETMVRSFRPHLKAAGHA